MDSTKKMGRVVVTHSTYIEGLIPLLKEIAKDKKVKTITPGVIKNIKGRSQKLKLIISIEIVGGYKAIARKGGCVQEVFIITSHKKSDLAEVIDISAGNI